jgi:hypothetical protein
MTAIKRILQSDSPPLNPPLFIFKRCPLAAAHNAQILQRFDFDLDRAIRSQHPSQISYGSEFRSSAVLEPLLFDHPFWARLKDILDNGASFPLTEMSDLERLTDVTFHSERGNHKSLTKYSSFIEPVINEDVERGFALPLPLETLKTLKYASLAPLGCHKQTTINTKGEIIPKYRLTHDQSFPGPSQKSVNLRVKKELLPPIMYSFVLQRVIHYIVNTRKTLPTTKIFICKVDLDAAYRRCSMASSTIYESLTIFDGLLLAALRLTFGGSPCPALWGIISESIADIGNSSLHNPFWDHQSLFDPISDTLESPLSLPDDIPFKAAADLSVNIPLNTLGYIDIYIDDNIGVTPDVGDNALRMGRAIPLAIRVLSRPVDNSDAIPRKDIISTKKFKAEGRLEETKKVLGWILNTRSLQISLPTEKFRDWSADIQKMISARKSYSEPLESLIGRINHVAGILHPLKHYMGRLYQALSRSSVTGGWTSFTHNELLDLETMLVFLSSAHSGISMNNLVFRKPTTIYRSDASEFGIGGYNLTSGIAWRFELPVDCRLRSSLNSLEFLACLISIWVDKFHQVLLPESCVLSQTDSSSALGWLRKSNFADKSDEYVQLSTARKLADIMLQSEICLYSQWFPGEKNIIADSLSRDFHLSDSSLSDLLISHFPDQAPFGLKILPLPPEIVSWSTCLLLSRPQKEPWSKEPTRSKFALGLGFNDTLGPLGSIMIPSSTTSHHINEPRSSALSLKPSERIDFVMESIVKPSSPIQSEPPWITYHRSLNWRIDQIQDWTEMDDLHCFYRNNCGDTDL